MNAVRVSLQNCGNSTTSLIGQTGHIPGEVLYQASDEATAQGLLRGKIPAAIGKASDLFSIDVRAFDQFGEPAFFEA
jgi:hypothetical protein